MEIQYIFAILNTIVVGVYLYSMSAFNFGHQGLAYLHNLLDNEPEKLGTDPRVFDVLENRDIPNMTKFTMQRTRVQASCSVAIIINLINYGIHPYDILLYSWMEYIIIGATFLVNLDVIGILWAMRRNRQTVDTICTAYDNVVREIAFSDKSQKTIVSIDKAFEELMTDINKALDEDNKNDNNEK